MKKLWLIIFILVLIGGSVSAAEIKSKIGVGGKIVVLNTFTGSLGIRVPVTPHLSYELNYLHLQAQHTPENSEMEYFDAGLYYLQPYPAASPSVFAAGLYAGGTLRGNVATALVAAAAEWRYNFWDSYWSRVILSLPYANGGFTLGFGLGVDYYF